MHQLVESSRALNIKPVFSLRKDSLLIVIFPIKIEVSPHFCMNCWNKVVTLHRVI